MAFQTPEEAAMVGFPARYCRVVATCVNGDVAYVLLDTGSDGLWSEGGSSNGPGWSQAGSDPHLGTLVDWGEAPPQADAVRLDFNGVVLEVAVNDGAYLTAWWRVPCPRAAWPRVEAFRIGRVGSSCAAGISVRSRSIR
jgi:hypothetical protein